MNVKFVNGNDPKEKSRIIDGCISELERHPEIGTSIIGTMTLDYIVEYLREYQNILNAPQGGIKIGDIMQYNEFKVRILSLFTYEGERYAEVEPVEFLSIHREVLVSELRGLDNE